MNATRAVTLSVEKTTSARPNARTESRLMTMIASATRATNTESDVCGHQYCRYAPAATTSPPSAMTLAAQ